MKVRFAVRCQNCMRAALWDGVQRLLRRSRALLGHGSTLEHERAAEFPYEMELGRFIASSGAVLYKNQTDFYKLAVVYDNFDMYRFT